MEEAIFIFALGILASFVLAIFLTKTVGPAFIFRKIRSAPPKGSSARIGLSCPWCSATWFALLVSTYQFLYLLDINWHLFPLWFFATTAGAIILNQSFTKE